MVNSEWPARSRRPFTIHHSPFTEDAAQKRRGGRGTAPLRASAGSVRPLLLAVVVSALLMARGQIAGAFAIFLVLAGRIFLGTFVVALELTGGEGLGRILVRLFRARGARVDAGGARLVVVAREIIGEQLGLGDAVTGSAGVNLFAAYIVGNALGD